MMMANDWLVVVGAVVGSAARFLSLLQDPVKATSVRSF
jgi:NAD/NADP transhydrogenase beta subunit